MKKKFIKTFILLIMIILLFNCTNNAPKLITYGKKIVKVNGEYITENLVNLFSDGTQMKEEQRQTLIDELINNFLVYQKAIKSDIMKDTIFINQLVLQERLTIANKYINEKLDVQYPTEDELLAYYQINKSKFDEDRKFAVIFIHPMRGKAFADSIYDLIKRKKTTFKKMAREFSIDTITGKNGGIIDRYFSYMNWTLAGYPMIDSIGFAMKKKGEVSPPIKTMQGSYVIVKLIDKIPSNKKYADVKNMIMGIVYQQKRQEKYNTFIDKLRQEAEIEYLE